LRTLYDKPDIRSREEAFLLKRRMRLIAHIEKVRGKMAVTPPGVPRSRLNKTLGDFRFKLFKTEQKLGIKNAGVI
jgi:hypothetical protein